MRIEPTVGRCVHYWPGEPVGQPRAATIAHVHPSGRVNLGYLETDGSHARAGGKHGVLLIQPGDERPVACFSEWPAAFVASIQEAMPHRGGYHSLGAGKYEYIPLANDDKSIAVDPAKCPVDVEYPQVTGRCSRPQIAAVVGTTTKDAN